MIYAGIGSRETPPPVIAKMIELGEAFAKLGHTLRSGGARGADSAFERGHRAWHADNLEIFQAHHATPRAIVEAAKFHPNWRACTPFARMLHGRNMMIMLGQNLDTPVQRVYFWTPGGMVTGGTGQALRVAVANNIPCYLVTADAITHIR